MKALTVFVQMASLLSLSWLPVAAETSSGAAEQSAEISADTKGQIKERALAVPKALAGVIAGLSIGVPVRISKDVRKETRRLAGTLRGDVGNDFGIMENIIVLGGAVPFGIIGGSILGTIRGTETALTYGSHQPFSKESLSLKEHQQEPDKQP